MIAYKKNYLMISVSIILQKPPLYYYFFIKLCFNYIIYIFMHDFLRKSNRMQCVSCLSLTVNTLENDNPQSTIPIRIPPNLYGWKSHRWKDVNDVTNVIRILAYVTALTMRFRSTMDPMYLLFDQHWTNQLWRDISKHLPLFYTQLIFRQWAVLNMTKNILQQSSKYSERKSDCSINLIHTLYSVTKMIWVFFCNFYTEQSKPFTL